MHWSTRLIKWLKSHNRGSVALSFAMTLPIYIYIMTIFVQYALMVNAKLMIARAAEVAARSAMTCLPTDKVVDEVDGQAMVRSAGYMALVPISPKSKDTPSPESTDFVQALRDAGLTINDNYANRYTYAQQAATIDIPNGDYAHRKSDVVEITIHYRFFLSIPFANLFIGQKDTVAGVTGRFTTITASSKVQLSHGRQAVANGNGWPN